MTIVNVTPPTLSGTWRVGQRVATSNGTWTSDDPLSFDYQWLRCDSNGANCVDIGGETGSTYLLTQTDLNKKLKAEVTATEVAPSGDFGGDLPPRLPESSGSTTNVASLTQLQNALNNVANGSIINITANINGNGGTLNIDRVASAAAPITIKCNPGVVLSNFNQWYLPQCAYIRFRGLEFSGFDVALKPTGSAHDIEIDGCHIHDCAGQGILVTASAYNIQIWNCEIHDNGDETNLDHGIYFGYARGDCVIANCLLYDNWAYNVQIYPDCPNLIYTCNTVDGGQVHADARGGTVIGSESGLTDNTISVGILGTNAAFYCIRNYHPGSGNNVYDSMGFGNGIGDFETGSGITYTNCTHADPLYVDRPNKDFHLQGGSPAIDYIEPARYGYVPPLDIEGNPRVTADAGCYAA